MGKNWESSDKNLFLARERISELEKEIGSFLSNPVHEDEILSLRKSVVLITWENFKIKEDLDAKTKVSDYWFNRYRELRSGLENLVYSRCK